MLVGNCSPVSLSLLTHDPKDNKTDVSVIMSPVINPQKYWVNDQTFFLAIYPGLSVISTSQQERIIHTYVCALEIMLGKTPIY